LIKTRFAQLVAGGQPRWRRFQRMRLQGFYLLIDRLGIDDDR
jgi:hypothetical protein